MVSHLLAVWIALQTPAPPDPLLEPALRRLSEEAEVFAFKAAKAVGEETLQQRALRPPPRFRPRIGKAALEAPPPRYQTREIVSEYGFSAFQEAPGILHEFRQVVSVDGRKLAHPEKALKILVMGVRSADDKLKNKMLRDFEKYGLHGAAMDFGPLLHLFTRRELAGFTFTPGGTSLIGADSARAIQYRQSAQPGSFTIFRDRQAVRVPLEGVIWVRESDHLPLRITLAAATEQDNKRVSYEAIVDYQLSSHGVLLPASVVFKETVEGQMTVENVFRYASFKMFTVDAEIKFTAEDPPPPK